MPETMRFHYMDNLRALAMLSGVVFHAALAYSPLMHPFFPAADRSQSPLVDAGIWFLHLFRMPLFFVVAGFFTALLIQRRGMGGMLRNRLRRIGLPLLVFCPLVIAAMAWATMHAVATVQHPSPLLAMIGQFARMENPPSAPLSLGHLWFLYYLLFFYVLTWVAHSLLPARLGAFLRGLHPLCWVLALPVLLMPALASVSAPQPAPESPLPQFWAFGFHGPFFVFGYLLFGHENLLDRLRRFVPWLLSASVVLYGVFLWLLPQQTLTAADPSATWLIALIEACVGTWMTLVCLVAGKALLDRGNRCMRWLSDASYWVYIVHFPVLLFLQYQLMDSTMGWAMKFAIVLVATSAVCLGSYQLLVRRTWIGRLLGVRRMVAVPAG